MEKQRYVETDIFFDGEVPEVNPNKKNDDYQLVKEYLRNVTDEIKFKFYTSSWITQKRAKYHDDFCMP